jgi:hypothetical protein
MKDEMVQTRSGKIRGFWGWLAISALLAVIVLALIGEIMVHRASPILKGRVIETLSTRFRSRVELDNFQVSLGRGLEVGGDGLRIFAPDEVVAAGAKLPVIAIKHFQFHSGLAGLFIKPMHVGVVHVSGLDINIPPREVRAQNTGPKDTHRGKMKIVVDEIVCDDSQLIIGTSKPGKDPKHFGLGGMLSSVGEFTGQLNRIGVTGTTETPNFSLDTANHGMPLHTKFAAIVDGTDGDTYLDKVEARLGQTNFTAKGAVINIKGKGHAVDLDVDVPNGRIQDFLQLAVKTEPAILSGSLGMKAKIHIRPGPERVAEKLGLKGGFTVQQIHFSNPKVQDKVDMLSLRAQGDPKDAKPGAADVQSQLKGQFTMESGQLNFSDLAFALPGGNVQMEGVYSLDGEQFEFHGKVRTEAKISQMVASRWKSLLLKPVDLFFTKNGGAEIPVKISGTKSEPKFGLDLHHKDDDKDASAPKDQKDKK